METNNYNFKKRQIVETPNPMHIYKDGIKTKIHLKVAYTCLDKTENCQQCLS
ncbi:hypothetical protein JHK82_041820 [Glycine max]|uniref:Uncharacterized protein n=1 Tax=Glycine max TaxID=3847 RepID=K7MAI4_SOYBN|nr:hypothetical protein JHK87_041782 [Glycine soja]KAG4948640.1 hypothetical protein JHK86_041879 [Glycine max]KAG4956109.1 hypothetical protein JHK85_042489 [Glycine max]KAG5104850.1 hypothetical protein JHK82_041820 [Glycine max]KAG5115976.1 hypothetical protein JHK84_042089 [Glycine max]